jgi:hypothetical protein
VKELVILISERVEQPEKHSGPKETIEFGKIILGREEHPEKYLHSREGMELEG